MISGYWFGAEAERSVTLGVYIAFQGTPAVRYSTLYMDLERAEHIPSRTKLWPPATGSQAPSVRITLFFLRKSTIALDKVPGIALDTALVVRRPHLFNFPVRPPSEVTRSAVPYTVAIPATQGISFDETSHRVFSRNVCFRRYSSVSIF